MGEVPLQETVGSPGTALRCDEMVPHVYRGALPTRKQALLGPYRRPMRRVLGGSQGGRHFLMVEVPIPRGPVTAFASCYPRPQPSNPDPKRRGIPLHPLLYTALSLIHHHIFSLSCSLLLSLSPPLSLYRSRMEPTGPAAEMALPLKGGSSAPHVLPHPQRCQSGFRNCWSPTDMKSCTRDPILATS